MYALKYVLDVKRSNVFLPLVLTDQEGVIRTVRWPWGSSATPLALWMTRWTQNGPLTASSTSGTCIKMCCASLFTNASSLHLTVSYFILVVLCESVVEYLESKGFWRFLFPSPDFFFSHIEFLGRTELPVATIKKDMENKGPSTKKLLLHEVPTGEVWVRLDFQLFDGRTPKWKERRPVDGADRFLQCCRLSRPSLRNPLP